MDKKDVNNRKKQASSWLDNSLEDEDYTTMRTDDVLTDDPEFPAVTSKKDGSPSLHRDVERKKSEMKNSTIGGF